MNVLVSYSRPRGKYGRYIFTVMIYFAHPTEAANIQVRREKVTYSCEHCGKWASITLSEKLAHKEHQKQGLLELYRYDRVEPHDYIILWLHDSELMHSQLTLGTVTNEGFSFNNYWEGADTKYKPPILSKSYVIDLYKKGYASKIMTNEVLYSVISLNWDEYTQEQAVGSIEEELVRKTMNAEPITIQELVLEPAPQLPAIEGQKKFIEGELRYVSD